MSVEMFREHVCDELLTIHKNLEPIKHFTTETLTLETIEKLVAHCGELVTAAKQIDDDATALLLRKIEMSFFALSTIEIIDDPEKFRYHAIHVVDLLEIALLAMNDAAGKNKDAIIHIIKRP